MVVSSIVATYGLDGLFMCTMMAGVILILLGATGDFSVLCGQSSGTTHVIVDVNGYFE